MRKRFAQCAVAVALQIAVLPALAATAPAWAADMMVKIHNFAFNPQRLTVKAGTTVVWENADDIPHTVVSTTKAFRSEALDTGDKFSFTFTSPGSYEYFCSLHPHMTGAIVVEASPSGNTAGH
jgi:plastocyanin